MQTIITRLKRLEGSRAMARRYTLTLAGWVAAAGKGGSVPIEAWKTDKERRRVRESWANMEGVLDDFDEGPATCAQPGASPK